MLGLSGIMKKVMLLYVTGLSQVDLLGFDER